MKPLFLRSALVLYWNLPVTCAPSTPWRRRTFRLRRGTKRWGSNDARPEAWALLSEAAVELAVKTVVTTAAPATLVKATTRKSQAVDFERGGENKKDVEL